MTSTTTESINHCCFCREEMTGRPLGTLTARGVPICQECLDALPDPKE